MFNEEEVHLIKPDHVSPGEMVPALQVFCTTNQYFDDLHINIIESFNGIPDYLSTTINEYPTVLRSSDRFICLDGQHLIDEARVNGHGSIRCLIEVADNCPDEEIAIRKAATRMLPLNGKCSYLETVRNVKALYKMMMETTENLVNFHHGGRRTGGEFINNKEENVRLILATRLGKSPKTISKYLNHSENLNDAAIESLMTSVPDQTVRPNKEFFEIAQSNKNKMVVELKSEGKPDNEITEAMSGYVLQMFDEYKRTGNIKNYASQQNTVSEDTQTEEPSTENSINNAISAKFLPKTFSYYPGNETPQEITSLNLNDVKAELATIAANLTDVSGNQGAGLNEITLNITLSIAALSGCLQKCSTLDLTNQEQEGGNEIWVN